MRVRGLLIDLLLLLPFGRGTERYRRRKRRRYASRHGLRAPLHSVPASSRALRLATSDKPTISIVITCYGNLPQVTACLRSIAENPPRSPYEIIVVEDCSGDPAIDALAEVEGLTFVRNPRNLGYLKTVNEAARSARGELLWLLNDDTLITAGAADALADTLARTPGPSAVGSLLLNMDGSVQEAGSIVWRDGTATNNGGTDPLDSANLYMHEADYCSAASLMLRRVDFDRLGGYDEIYAPAYYEDTDLAFRLRTAGGRVLVQPASRVVHLGGGSHGSKTAFELIRRNREKFVHRWRAVLDSQFSPDHQSFAARDRVGASGAVLVLGSGDADAETARRVATGGPVVKLWLEDRRAAAALAIPLGGDGVEVVSANPEEALDRWLSQHAPALRAMIIGDADAARRRRWERLAARYALPVTAAPASSGPGEPPAG